MCSKFLFGKIIEFSALSIQHFESYISFMCIVLVKFCMLDACAVPTHLMWKTHPVRVTAKKCSPSWLHFYDHMVAEVVYQMFWFDGLNANWVVFLAPYCGHQVANLSGAHTTQSRSASRNFKGWLVILICRCSFCNTGKEKLLACVLQILQSILFF